MVASVRMVLYSENCSSKQFGEHSSRGRALARLGTRARSPARSCSHARSSVASLSPFCGDPPESANVEANKLDLRSRGTRQAFARVRGRVCHQRGPRSASCLVALERQRGLSARHWPALHWRAARGYRWRGVRRPVAKRGAGRVRVVRANSAITRVALESQRGAGRRTSRRYQSCRGLVLAAAGGGSSL